MAEPNPAKEKSGATGLRRIYKAMHYSFAGLHGAFTGEAAFRQEVWLAIPLVLIALFLPMNSLTGAGRAMLISSVFLVLIAELANSAIEAVVDRVSLAQHPLSKRAKDIGSAAVLLALVNVVLVWSCVLW